MMKRCIGIDIGSSNFRVVQLARTEDGLCIERVFGAQIRRSTDSLPQVLRSLAGEHGFDSRAAVAFSLPQDAVFFRNVQTDAAGLKQIREHDSSALAHHFPIPPDEIIAQPYSHREVSDGTYSVLTAAVGRQTLNQRRALLAEAKLRAALAEAAIFAVHSAVTVNHPDITEGAALIAYVDESHLTLAVTQDNNILIVRNLRVMARANGAVGSAEQDLAELLAREAAVSWRKVVGSEIEQDTRLYLALGADVPADVSGLIEEKLPWQVIPVDPYAHVKPGDGGQVNGTICVAEGLALRLLAPEKSAGVNFLEAAHAQSKPALNVRKELVICAALVGAIIIFALVGMFVKLFCLEKSYTRLKNEITEVFQAALPEEKNMVNPLVQLEQKIQSFQKDYQLFAAFHPTSLAPLDVLQQISTSMPSEGGFKVDDLLITPDSVRVSGTCNSFESVYYWQGVLQELGGFGPVDVDAQKESESGVVSFTILMSAQKSLAPAGDVWETAVLLP